MSAASVPADRPRVVDAPVVGLRRCTLHRGRRDMPVALSGRARCVPRQASGMRVSGPFRDPDDPGRCIQRRRFPAAVPAALPEVPRLVPGRGAPRARLIDRRIERRRHDTR